MPTTNQTELVALTTKYFDALTANSIDSANIILGAGETTLGSSSQTVFSGLNQSQADLGAGDDTFVALSDSTVTLGYGVDTLILTTGIDVTITDFNTAIDRIDLSHLGVLTFSELSLDFVGSNLLISTQTGETITLNNPGFLVDASFVFANQFQYGVASGDPYSDSVVLWTQVTTHDATANVSWEVATDLAFENVVDSGVATTNGDRDYTVKVIADGLDAGQTYYYRFTHNGQTSDVGTTKTLPEVGVESVNLAVVSCANFERGYFNPFQVIAEGDYDAIVHLGDYIYEYETKGYSNADATYTRSHLPRHEILSLDDYRERYATYHTDEGLIAARQSAPMIAIWDDHETANNAYATGAQNHSASEGPWTQRVDNALQAYYEWVPIRDPASGDRTDADRSFEFGDLLDLHMLETRLQARSEELSLPGATDVTSRVTEIVSDVDLVSQYATMLGVSPTGAEFESALVEAVTGELIQATLVEAATGARTMAGQVQLSELIDRIEPSDAIWQILGSPTQMARLNMPIDYLTGLGGAIAAVGAGVAPDVSFIEPYQTAVVQALAGDPTALNAIQAAPKMPESFDNWGGFGAEREAILAYAEANNLNLLTIAGDSHNAWAGDLTLADGTIVGHEFGAPGISAPGFDQVNQLLDVSQVDDLYPVLIDDIRYVDFTSKGFLDLNVTREQAIGTFKYVDTVFDQTYTEITSDPIVVSLVEGMVV